MYIHDTIQAGALQHEGTLLCLQLSLLSGSLPHVVEHRILAEVRQVELGELVREVVKVGEDLRHVAHAEEARRLGGVRGVRALQAAKLEVALVQAELVAICLLYTSPSPRDKRQSRMPSSA